jgi:hypothetical protein
MLDRNTNARGANTGNPNCRALSRVRGSNHEKRESQSAPAKQIGSGRLGLAGGGQNRSQTWQGAPTRTENSKQKKKRLGGGQQNHEEERGDRVLARGRSEPLTSAAVSGVEKSERSKNKSKAENVGCTGIDFLTARPEGE